MEKCRHAWYCYLLFFIIFVGAINWGLIGFFDFDLVQKIVGGNMTAAKVIYDIVGVSAILILLASMVCPGCKGACKTDK